MALRLEVFDNPEKADETPLVVLQTIAFEDAKLAAYDTGYQAGWDDAMAAHRGDQAQISADLARHLQSLVFTFDQARDHVLAAMQPLLTEVVARLLPEVARAALPLVIAEHLMPLAAAGAAAVPVTILVNPAAHAAVMAATEAISGLPLTILDEPSLGEGQAFLRFDQAEQHIDLGAAIAEISAALRSFYTLSERMPSDG